MGRKRASLARRAFAWAVFAFLVVQISLGVLTDVDGLPVRDPEYAFREDQLRAVKAANPGRPVIVVLGTSRTMVGINAKRLTEAGGPVIYNCGLPGAGPTRQLAAWRRLVAHGLKPDAIAIEILPALHTHAGQQLFESGWNDAGRLSYSEAVELLPWYARPWRGAFRWTTARIVPLARYSPAAYRDYYASGMPYTAPSSEGIPTDNFGWRQGISKNAWEPERRANATRMLLKQYQRACTDTRPAPGEPLFERLLAEIEAAGVPVVAFAMPECRDFREQSQAVATVYPRVREACGKHGVSFVDAGTWMPDDAFWDGHHLHPEPADGFTDRFADEVLQPLVSKTTARLVAAR